MLEKQGNFGVLYLFSLVILLEFSTCFGFVVFQEKRFVNSSELCVIPITPSLFNWEKSPESVNEIEYTARISGSPDLPNWLKYTYDGVSSTGYIFGVPPDGLKSINLDIVALNRYADYEVRMLIISIEIRKRIPDIYTVEMKIDSMDVRHLCNHTIRDKVLGIFSKYMNWTYGDGQHVHPIYLASAVELGENRVPLRPGDPEGVVIHFASDRNFSKALFRLEAEVKKLPKLKPCPRDMKWTSMERYFRNKDVSVDWCYFRLRTINITSATTSGKSDGEAVKHVSTPVADPNAEDIFVFRTEIPERSYGMGIILATVIPGTIGGLVGFLLLALLWTDRDEDREVIKRRNAEESDYRSAHEPEIDNIGIITRDRLDTEPDPRDTMHTPLPPQYGETHPNGSPALIYAV